MKERQINLNPSDLTKMKDFLGNELQIGDEVIFVKKHGSSTVELSKGTIVGLTNTMADIEEDNNYWKAKFRCSGQNIYKININIQ